MLIKVTSAADLSGPLFGIAPPAPGGWVARRGLFLPFADLLDATWLELPSWPFNKEVFQDELAFAAIQWPAAVVTLDLTV
jgi:hypothetical protein